MRGRCSFQESLFICNDSCSSRGIAKRKYRSKGDLLLPIGIGRQRQPQSTGFDAHYQWWNSSSINSGQLARGYFLSIRCRPANSGECSSYDARRISSMRMFYPFLVLLSLYGCASVAVCKTYCVSLPGFNRDGFRSGCGPRCQSRHGHHYGPRDDRQSGTAISTDQAHALPGGQ